MVKGSSFGARITTPIPATETTLDSVNRLVIDGDKLRYEDNHPCWYMPVGKLNTGSSVTVFNGTVNKWFYPRDHTGDGVPTAVFSNGDPPNVVQAHELIPFFLAFRGTASGRHSSTYPEMKATGVELPIDGAACQECLIKLSADLTVSYWLDPAKDYIVRRTCTQHKGRLDKQFDVRYCHYDGYGWVPTSWTRNLFSTGGTILMTTTVEVLDLRLNDPQPADLFERQFPAGTYAVDRTTAKRYHVQPDGSMREVSPEGEELSESFAQPGASWYEQHKGLLVGLVVAIAILICATALRMKRARAA
jgi:hypothetical protein